MSSRKKNRIKEKITRNEKKRENPEKNSAKKTEGK